ncbi:BlaI/MecI/CopY family transcriptional regulator [bacterium]|jgi:BlaI family transcriptional regulator, penicillinase repressor|nr:BlaI/MecI/CopY family transcriptional regulator [bacterium]
MSTPPKISDTEWEIMRVLWNKNPLTSGEIKERTGMHLQTAKTYLGRLVKKGALGFSKSGRSYLYRPLFTEDECQKQESRSFLDRVFGGALHPMLSHLVEEDALSDEEVAKLRKVLNQRKRKQS